MSKKTVLPVVTILLCLFSVIFYAAAKSNKDMAKKKLKTVFAKPVKLTEIFDKFTYPARVDSRVQATVLADAVGIVNKLGVELGDKVVKNQVLVKIQNSDPVYRFATQKIMTPISGVVGEIFITNGNQVNKSEKLLTIIDPTDLRIKIEIPVTDLKFFKKGQIGQLKLHYMKESVGIKIVGIGPIVSSLTGTSTVELEINDNKLINQVKVGSLGKVWFKLNEHKGLSVPDHAIGYVDRKPSVKVVRDNVLNRVKITLGEKREGQVEIIEGIKDGDIVVTRASGFVADGDKVIVK